MRNSSSIWVCAVLSADFDNIISVERTNCLVFFQAEDGIRDLVRSRGLGDVYKRQVFIPANQCGDAANGDIVSVRLETKRGRMGKLEGLFLIHI